MLNWSQTDLAGEAGLSVETIKRLEKMAGTLDATKVSTLTSIIDAFSKAGVEFTNGGAPGVRLRPK